ncbi:penicillin-binding protein 1B [Glaciecola sp. XM2]|uniref:penicillin-binding protein 1B n=1 Tax=Glaciecola sp. XM2 TaxID=1914931 RepID=UPI001BDE2036|nr:penicillin-binding protein 1B [Glaciecola sp. XM2]MBT1451634.1 penicillin-binding protein 1B [Glaciecola sp. XM2]
MKIRAVLFAPFRWIKRHFVKLSLVILAVLISYLIYIDAQVKEHFSGNKWEVPAQIYARPLVLTLNQEITPSEVQDELALLGYRQVADAQNVGEFSLGKDRLTVFRRAFEYADMQAPERVLDVRWSDARISSLELLDTQQQARSVMLEPWLISRLVGGLSEDRMLMQYEDIPELLKIALIEVEDKDFYQHHGIAPLSIIRALMANISAGRTVQGGSTLTQQLAKNLYLTREQTYTRKLKEAAMALVIDARYSKDEILNAYLNEVFLGQNGAVAVHGFGLASHFYFNKPLQELELVEIATLVGMVKGPSFYHPIRHKQRSTERRDLVLRILFDQQYLTSDEYRSALAQPLVTSSSPSLASGEHPAFMDKVSDELYNVVPEVSTRLSGVKVFTTLDVNAQLRAEKALVEQVQAKAIARGLPDLEAAMVVSDIATGEIRAMVGGKRPEFAGFNRALNAYRPIGSLIKPVVYLAALEDPFTYNLGTRLADSPIEFDDKEGQKWRPQNADKTFRGEVSLLEALTQSYNVPSVVLADEMGFDVVVATLQRLGYNKSVEPLPSVSLGAVEMSVLEVNQIYQVMSNNGVLKPLHALSAVTTHDDQLLWKREDVSQRRADEDASYILNYALHKVTQEGTAKAVGETFKTINMAGKTGTTDDYRDSWFAGFDRNLVTSVWVGNDDNSPVNMSGASGALQIFIDFQKQNKPKSLSRRFPSTLTIAHFDQLSGANMQPGCANVMSVPAIASALEPGLQCAQSRENATKPPPKKKRSWLERIFDW